MQYVEMLPIEIETLSADYKSSVLNLMPIDIIYNVFSMYLPDSDIEIGRVKTWCHL